MLFNTPTPPANEYPLLFRLLASILFFFILGFFIIRKAKSARRRKSPSAVTDANVSESATATSSAHALAATQPISQIPPDGDRLFDVIPQKSPPKHLQLNQQSEADPGREKNPYRLQKILTRAQRRALARQAKFDYRHARGYVHRSMLQTAKQNLLMQIATEQANIKRIKQEISKVRKQKKQALLKQLEYYIVRNRFDEVPGIGPALKERIISELKPKRLADLSNAFMVSGVGQTRQAEIIRWARKYRAKLPELIDKPFPGRASVEARFAKKLQKLESALQQAKLRCDKIGQTMQEIEKELSWLEDVTADDFKKAILSVSDANQKIERFAKGIFPDWESAPKWFREATKGKKPKPRRSQTPTQFLRRVKTKPLPLVFQLDALESGQHVLRIFKKDGDNLVPVRNSRHLTKYNYMEISPDGRTLFVVGEKHREILRAVHSLNPEATEDGKLIFDATPPILNHLRRQPDVQESAASQEITVSSTPLEPVLKVDYDKETGLTLQMGYATGNSDEVVPAGESVPLRDGYIRVGKQISPTPTHLSAVAQKLLAEPEQRIRLDDVPEFFARDLVLLSKDFRAVLTEPAAQIRVIDEPWQPVVSVAKTSDGWLDFQVKFRVGGEELPEDVLNTAGNASKYHRINENTWVRRKQATLDRVDRGLHLLEPVLLADGYRVPISQFASLQDFIDDIGGLAQLSRDYQEFLEQLTDFCASEHFRLHEEIERDLRANGILLRPYQRAGIHWMHWLQSHYLHGLLADDMGLGKTIQSICTVRQAYMDSKNAQHSLVIAPQSVLLHWKREIERVYPGISTLVYHGQSRFRYQQLFRNMLPTIFITTYSTAANDIAFLQTIPFYFLILDEATQIKNPTIKRTVAIKSLNAAHRFALSGTPVENRPRELWSIFDFLMRGHLGRYGTFQRVFESLIVAGDPDASERLGKRIRPFLLRRRKDEVAQDLPAKIEMDEWCELTAEQRLLYGMIQEQAKSIRAALARGEQISYTGSILPVIIKLKQICDHPAILTGDKQRLYGRSRKFDRIIDKIRSIRKAGEQVVIFSHYLDMLDLLEQAVKNEGASYIRIDGSTRKRQNLIDRFNAGEASVALCSLMAAGHGINLTAANHVIHADRWWNPAIEDQATDRVHRIGQQQTVYVYRILTQGTLEEHIDQLLAKKRDISTRIMEMASAGGLQWTREELLEILRPLEE